MGRGERGKEGERECVLVEGTERERWVHGEKRENEMVGGREEWKGLREIKGVTVAENSR